MFDVFKDNGIVSAIDLSVYSTNRQMRTIWSFKYGETDRSRKFEATADTVHNPFKVDRRKTLYGNSYSDDTDNPELDLFCASLICPPTKAVDFHFGRKLTYGKLVYINESRSMNVFMQRHFISE